MQRKNFSFRFEWQQAIAHLEPELRLEVYEQTILYAKTGRAYFRTGLAEAAFNEYILPDFRRREKAAAYRARRKAALAQKASETDDKSATTESVVTAAPTAAEVVAPTTLPTLNRRDRRRLAAEARRRARKGRATPTGIAPPLRE